MLKCEKRDLTYGVMGAEEHSSLQAVITIKQDECILPDRALK